MPDGTKPTQPQLDRAERSLAILRQKGVPVEPDAGLVEDDTRIALRSPQETARRVLVLLCVVQRAEAAPRDMVLRRMEKSDLWSAATPAETRFLRCDVPDEEECKRLVWRVESIWTLMWALGHIEELAWPAESCDVPWLAIQLDSDRGIPDLVGSAALRPEGEILDALDLTSRIDRVIEQARQTGAPIPANLDWSRPDAIRPVGQVKAAPIVRERCRSLRWLVRFQDADWDDLEKSVPKG